MNTDGKRDEIQTLAERLEGLTIVVSGKEGNFTVASYCEPLFCFDARSHQEVADKVAATLKSYVSTFYNVNDVHVSIREVAVNKPTVPVRRIEPVSYLKPTFATVFPNQQGFAFVRHRFGARFHRAQVRDVSALAKCQAA